MEKGVGGLSHFLWLQVLTNRVLVNQALLNVFEASPCQPHSNSRIQPGETQRCRKTRHPLHLGNVGGLGGLGGSKMLVPSSPSAGFRQALRVP